MGRRVSWAARAAAAWQTLGAVSQPARSCLRWRCCTWWRPRQLACGASVTLDCERPACLPDILLVASAPDRVAPSAGLRAREKVHIGRRAAAGSHERRHEHGRYMGA